MSPNNKRRRLENNPDASAKPVKPAKVVDRVMRRADDVDHAIAESLRAARERAGLTQQELAAELDVSYQQLQKYERGVNRVSGSVLFRSAQILGVSAMDLFPDAGDAQRNDEVEPRDNRPGAPRARKAAVTPVAKAIATKPTGELEEFAEICDRILKLQSPRLRRALLAVVQQSVDDETP